jgi:UDP-N-acetylmuramoylalanine--D-glutamate ligase
VAHRLRLADLAAPAVAAGSLRGAVTLVLGAGRTGQAVARFAAAAGAAVTLHDSSAAEKMAEVRARFEGSEVSCAFGVDAPLHSLFERADLVVHSPSVTLGFPSVRPEVAAPLAAFAARALPLAGGEDRVGPVLISEPEWTLRLLGERWRVGVTGTKGKTTTSALIAAILAADPGHPVELGGNNGVPLIERTVAMDPRARVVMELSELQLPSIASHVDIAVYTNVTVDHLDRHGSVEGYRRVKHLLADRVAETGALVVNLDDPVTASYAGEGRVETITYRRGSPLPGGLGVVDDWIVAAGVRRAARYGGGAAATGPGGRVMPVAEIALLGEHSLSNVLAAVAVGLVAGVAPDAIRGAVAGFRGLPHRLEPVGEIDGVRFVNDGQATQPDAVIAAMRTFPKPLILIAGGRSKGADLRELARVAAERCSGAVLIGELADELERTFRAVGIAHLARAESIAAAAQAGLDLADAIAPRAGSARRGAAPRATVILSPIGSSYDMFNNPFGARGDAFRDAVRDLAARVAS